MGTVLFHKETCFVVQFHCAVLLLLAYKSYPMNSAIIGFLMYSNGWSVEFSISTGNAEFSRCAANLRS